jgi:hypothetical protein
VPKEPANGPFPYQLCTNSGEIPAPTLAALVFPSPGFRRSQQPSVTVGVPRDPNPNLLIRILCHAHPLPAHFAATCRDATHWRAVGGSVERRWAAKKRPARPGCGLRPRAGVGCGPLLSGEVSLPVVGELPPLAICNCGFAPKPAVTYDFGSQRFSSFHAVFGAHVPSMCPVSFVCLILDNSTA